MMSDISLWHKDQGSELYAEYEPDDDLLMNRETHLCAYNGFEDQFSAMFNNTSNLLFMNPLLSQTFNPEISANQMLITFLQQVIGFQDFSRAISAADELA